MSTAVGKQALETQAPASEDRAGVPGSGREVETAEDSIADRVGAGNAAMAMDDVDELAEDDMLEVTQMDVDVDASPNQGVALNTSVGPGAAPCATNAFPDDAERPTKRPRFTPEAPGATGALSVPPSNTPAACTLSLPALHVVQPRPQRCQLYRTASSAPLSYRRVRAGRPGTFWRRGSGWRSGRCRRDTSRRPNLGRMHLRLDHLPLPQLDP